MIRRSTWIALVILAALIGVVFYLRYEQQAVKAESKTVPTPTVAYLFNTTTDGQPVSIKIEDATGTTVEVARDSSQAWAIDQPTRAEADQSSSEAAATQISSLRPTDEVDLAPDILGLDKPAYTVTIGFDSGKQHVMKIGSQTPTQSGYYVQVDSNKSVIVASEGIEALLNLFTAPPYKETPTPSVTPSPIPPTSTPAPATAAPVATDTTAVTPTP
ncbi:MAG TPA: DUF4340 domain-containing protein [Anaerolineales bacterium]|nr:DUF4340 domain-containing protein [Anaerolineales bacterium]